MSEFEKRVLADLAILKTQVASLVGNGQPGRIRLIEERIEGHEAALQRGKALLIVIVPVVTVLHLIIHFVRMH